MKKLFIIMVIFGVAANTLYAGEKALIDPKLEIVEIGLEKQKKQECKNKKNLFAMMQCGQDIRKKARKEGKIRGSEEYCERHYDRLDFTALEQLFKKLNEQQKTARKSLNILNDNDRKYGELSKEDLQTEISWIETRLAQMQKEKTNQKEKKLHYGEIK